MTSDPKLALPVDSERDHTWGPDDAPVTLLEYGDYECPHCRDAHPVVKTLKAVLKDKLRFAYRNFPLRHVHTHAQKAAEAAEAAAAQGHFWEMNDVLIKHQNDLTINNLVHYAEDIGMNVDQFQRDLHSGTFADRVQVDVRSAEESGVKGTPSFFINGVRHRGAYDYDTLYAAIKSAMDAEH